MALNVDFKNKELVNVRKGGSRQEGDEVMVVYLHKVRLG